MGFETLTEKNYIVAAGSQEADSEENGSQNLSPDETENGVFREEISRKTETAPGVTEERRFILRASLATLTALLFGAGASQSKSATARHGIGGFADSEEIDFEKFIEKCSALAKEAVADSNLNEDAHLFRLAEVAARLQAESVPVGKLSAFGGLDPTVEIAPIRRAAPLVIIQWRLAPYATFPAHNHNPADVLTLCLKGECRVRHFDIVGDAPDYSSKETFLIRETQNLLLSPGRMSSLTRTRDNIHTFRAGKEGAMGIDINTSLPGNKPFSFLRFGDRPRDAERLVYEASWMKL